VESNLPSPDQIAWLNGIAPMAVDCERRTGCPAALTLAQAIFESGWGKNAPQCNFFGVKWHQPYRWQLLSTTEWFTQAQVLGFLQADPRRQAVRRQPVQSRGDRDLYDCKDMFCAYDSAGDAFADHARILTKNRYAPAWNAFQIDHDAEHFVRAIGPIYSTTPGYADQILSMMHSPAVVGALAGVDQPGVVT
jgi:flagellum-specific peptidoglycan hydrolase FlgJ